MTGASLRSAPESTRRESSPRCDEDLFSVNWMQDDDLGKCPIGFSGPVRATGRGSADQTSAGEAEGSARTADIDASLVGSSPSLSPWR